MAIGYEQDEFESLAAQDYNKNGFFNLYDFEKDLANIITTKKMASRFLKTGVVNDKLLINNIVLSLNAFGIRRANELLFIACTDDQYGVVKAILEFLGSHSPDLGAAVEPNRIIVELLRDIEIRYNLKHLN
jgi:hypothetical protein